MHFPGTAEERGINKWRVYEELNDVTPGAKNAFKIYDLPLIQKYLDKYKICRYLPFCPRFFLTSRNTNEEIDDPENGMARGSLETASCVEHEEISKQS